jgi:hypothetical protein
LSVIVQRQAGGEVRLHQALEDGAFWLASVAKVGSATRFRGSGGHGHPDRVIGINDPRNLSYPIPFA